MSGEERMRGKWLQFFQKSRCGELPLVQFMKEFGLFFYSRIGSQLFEGLACTLFIDTDQDIAKIKDDLFRLHWVKQGERMGKSKRILAYFFN